MITPEQVGCVVLDSVLLKTLASNMKVSKGDVFKFNYSVVAD